ncbi:uncharacterized protein MONBRDRAFT_28930 [Monosiga brevicollis MX1]|uniref:Uncharacterized protein n=1 Tax=Monosiga brevicollis TaxID=81824 RepID=A9V9L6_MONBE|nr:uncharacterized protein MONBRDRAFT_28930 [Monosiga brevicollis MX1]EDQ85743.1 predicted protein [Monosiga brevicollis MX1]|eukprot:XP_001749458.1 hypothetical protein [Monosiga brevicollis MX1]
MGHLVHGILQATSEPLPLGLRLAATLLGAQPNLAENLIPCSCDALWTLLAPALATQVTGRQFELVYASSTAAADSKPLVLGLEEDASFDPKSMRDQAGQVAAGLAAILQCPWPVALVPSLAWSRVQAQPQAFPDPLQALRFMLVRAERHPQALEPQTDEFLEPVTGLAAWTARRVAQAAWQSRHIRGPVTAAGWPLATVSNPDSPLLSDLLAELMRFTHGARLNPDTPLAELGLSSREAVELHARLQTRFAVTLPISVAYDHPTAQSLALAINRRLSSQPTTMPTNPGPSVPRQPQCEALVISGMACHFPAGCDNLVAFWEHLARGQDGVTPIPEERFAAQELRQLPAHDPRHMPVQAAGLLEGANLFDAAFFNVSPREAEDMDPQQRLLLHQCYSALVDAGYDRTQLAGRRVGVYVGVTHSDWTAQPSDGQTSAFRATGAGRAIHANRLSFWLGLSGPSLSVDTACSSSLVALHLARRALDCHEIDLAIVAASNLLLGPDFFIAACRAGMLATDGRCKTFAATADGYGRGEGVAALILEPADRASSDAVYAQLDATAINQDGRTQSLTAPSGAAQEALITEAMATAALRPEELNYIEAHGTGTALGDPVEVQAIQRALCLSEPSNNAADAATGPRHLVLGAVKSNIGHLEGAAGLAGVIKAVLSLNHGRVPGNLHMDPSHATSLNPHLGLASAITLSGPGVFAPLPSKPVRWHAGISSFGFGGTNAHAIVSTPSHGPHRTQHRAQTYHPVPVRTFEGSGLLTTNQALRTQASTWSVRVVWNRSECQFLASHVLGSQLACVPATAMAGLVDHLVREAWHCPTVELTEAQLLNVMLVPSGPAARLWLQLTVHDNTRATLDAVDANGAVLAHHFACRLTKPSRDASTTVHEGPRVLTSAQSFDAWAAMHTVGHGIRFKGPELYTTLGNAYKGAFVAVHAGVMMMSRAESDSVLTHIQPSSAVGEQHAIVATLDALLHGPLHMLAKSKAGVRAAPRYVQGWQSLQLHSWASLRHGVFCRAVRASSSQPVFDITAWNVYGDLLVSWRGVKLPAGSAQTASLAHPVLDGLLTQTQLKPWTMSTSSSAANLACVCQGTILMPERIATDHAASVHATSKDDVASWCGAVCQAATGSGRGRQLHVFASRAGNQAAVAQFVERLQGLQRRGDQARVLWLTVSESNNTTAIPAWSDGHAEAALVQTLALETSTLAPVIHVHIADAESGSDRAAACRSILQLALSQPGTNSCVLSNGSFWRRMQQRISPSTQRLWAIMPVSDTPAVTRTAFVVTGGLGGLGLRAVLQLLTTQDPALIVLVGRQARIRQADAATWTAIQRHAGQRTRLRIACADVSNAAHVLALGRVVRAELQTLPHSRLTAILHTAGVLQDGTFMSLQPRDWRATAAPKQQGLAHLHGLALYLGVRVPIVAYSSVTACFGAAGQANYAYANAYMDEMMEARCNVGLFGLALQWGPWAEGGMASREARALARFAQQGIGAVSDEQGQAALALALHLMARACQAETANRPAIPSTLCISLLASQTSPSTTESVGTSPLESAPQAQARAWSEEDVSSQVVQVVSNVAALDLALDDPFMESGLDSLVLIEVRQALNQTLGLSLASHVLFDYPSPRALAQHIVACHSLTSEGAEVSSLTTPRPIQPSAGLSVSFHRPGRDYAIAITGLGCRFPGGATGLDRFWKVLESGRDCISPIPLERFDVEGKFNPNPEVPNSVYVKSASVLENIDTFDARAFGLSNAEAAVMDPQQRLLLEVCNDALIDAGYTREQLRGRRVGVYVGCMTLDYVWALKRVASALLATGGSRAILSNRLSYVFDFRGPSMTIDTACSSALVGLHGAAQCLQDCDVAVVAGINMFLSSTMFELTCKARMLSPDARCRSFDASANGYVRGEGVGALVLERMAPALLSQDDRVYAELASTALNQDGRSAGLTAPRGPAQQEVIRDALEKAGLEPTDVAYVETHGTGTALGDPIETGALRAVFGDDADRTQPLVLGALKSNMGHTEGAAGIAGLIKAVLCLNQGRVPGNLHLQQLNPSIAMDNFDVAFPGPGVGLALPDASKDGQVYACVNSFGFGGANAHCIVGRGADWVPRRPSAAAVYKRRWFPTFYEHYEFAGDRSMDGPTRAKNVSSSPVVYEGRWGPRLLHFFAQHVVGHTTVCVPGTALLLFAQRCAVRELGEASFSFDDVQLEHMIRFDAQTSAIFVRCELNLSTGAVLVATRMDEHATWTSNLQGRVVSSPQPKLQPHAAAFDWEACTSASVVVDPHLVLPTPEAVYAYMDNRYQGAFKGILRAVVCGERLLAVVRGGCGDAHGDAHAVAWLDATVHAIAILDAQVLGLDMTNRAHYVQGWEQWWLAPVVRGAELDLNVSIQYRQDGKYDVDVHDCEQQRLCSLRGVLVGSYDVTNSKRVALAPVTLQQVWQPLHLTDSPSIAGMAPPQDALLLVEPELAASVPVAWHGNMQLLESLIAHDLQPKSVKQIVLLTWGRHGTSLHRVLAAITAYCHVGGVSQLLWVTVGPAQAQWAAAGLRSAAIHEPQLEWQHVHIVAKSPEESCLSAVSFALALGPHALSERSVSLTVLDDGKVRADALRLDHCPGTLNICVARRVHNAVSGRVFVITGGLGALGLLTAEWLLEYGAAHVCLLTRSGSVEKRSAARWTELRKAYTDSKRLTVARCDTSSLPQVLALVRALEHTIGPVQGLIHSAGVLADALLPDLTMDHIERVMRPKVCGLWHWHWTLLAARRSTLAVKSAQPTIMTYSSLAAIVASPGQINYSLANALLDNLVQERASVGLVGASVQWGAWAEVGMAARKNSAVHLKRLGLGEVTSTIGRAGFDAAMTARPGTTIAVSPLDWNVVSGRVRATADKQYLERLLRSTPAPQRPPQAASPSATAPQQVVPTQHSKAEKKPSIVWDKRELEGVVFDALQDVAGELPALDDTLESVGLDSLALMELRQTLTEALGFTLSAAVITGGITPRLLLATAEKLLNEQPGSNDRSPSAISQSLSVSSGSDSLQSASEAASSASSLIGEAQNQIHQLSHADVCMQVVALVADLVGDDIESDMSFAEAGMDSLTLLELRQAVRETFDLSLAATDLNETSTTNTLVEHIWAAQPALHPSEPKEPSPEPIFLASRRASLTGEEMESTTSQSHFCSAPKVTESAVGFVRSEFGSVQFLGPVPANISLRTAVHFGPGQIELDSILEDLPAIVQLLNIAQPPTLSSKEFQQALLASPGLTSLAYEPTAQTWTFAINTLEHGAVQA